MLSRLTCEREYVLPRSKNVGSGSRGVRVHPSCSPCASEMHVSQDATSTAARRLADLPRDARIVIVEGVFKADVLYAIRPKLHIVATPCVTANHGGFVELTRGRPVWIGFDQDHY